MQGREGLMVEGCVAFSSCICEGSPVVSALSSVTRVPGLKLRSPETCGRSP